MRRILVVLVLVAMAMFLAVPALAQTGADGDPMTWEALGTVAGASVAAGVIVQVLGLALSLTAKAKRLIAVVSGLVVVVAVTLSTTDPPTVAVVGLAAYNGMLAGLAASKAQEALSHGLDHSIQDA